MKKSSESARKLAAHIDTFIHYYAPAHKTNSEHTLKSYKTAISLFLEFLEDEKGIDSSSFGPSCFEKDKIEDWLVWLKEKRNCSPETCNVRLSGLRVFLEYLAGRDIEYITLKNEASTIPKRKTKKKKISGLSREAVKTLFQTPDVTKKAGLRDLVLMIVLYSSAARIDEVLSLTIGQVHLKTSKPNITVIGKGDKVRTIYISRKTADHIKKYIEVFHGDNPNSDGFLFYSRNGGIFSKMTQPAVAKQLKKHAVVAHEKCDEVPIDLHAHQFRHAKASHWLEDGLNIVQISMMLGHANLETTMVYLDISEQQKLASLSKLNTEEDKTTIKHWSGNISKLKQLCGIE